MPPPSTYLKEALGFDLSRGRRIGCSQCQPCVVNGTPIHERGCPHDTHECNGCNNRIPVRQRYCEDCQ